MAQFDDNWGLQAIVRGSSTTTTSTFSGYNGDLDFQINDVNGFVFGDENLFQNHHQVTTLMLKDDDEFQQIYQPFYPVWDSSSSSPPPPHDHQPTSNDMKLQESDRKQLISSPPDQYTSANAQTTPKYKRRKNQQKRVVVQSGAGEGVPSDMWAWRKYGQKPIKGSPYPRSYYRCSTSKSCIAKKQVEQSCTEAGVNIITYTAEHNHSQPIRKNALAGTTRQKFPTTTQVISSNYDYINKGAENRSNTIWSPPGPGSTSGGDQNIASSISNINEDGWSHHGGVSLKEEIKMEEEFFAGLEDLDGFISELVGFGGQHHQYCSTTSKMFSINF